MTGPRGHSHPWMTIIADNRLVLCTRSLETVNARTLSHVTIVNPSYMNHSEAVRGLFGGSGWGCDRPVEVEWRLRHSLCALLVSAFWLIIQKQLYILVILIKQLQQTQINGWTSWLSEGDQGRSFLVQLRAWIPLWCWSAFTWFRSCF